MGLSKIIGRKVTLMIADCDQKIGDLTLGGAGDVIRSEGGGGRGGKVRGGQKRQEAVTDDLFTDNNGQHSDVDKMTNSRHFEQCKFLFD